MEARQPITVGRYEGQSFSIEEAVGTNEPIRVICSPAGDLLLEWDAPEPGDAHLTPTDGETFSGRFSRRKMPAGTCKFDVFFRDDRLTMVGDYRYDAKTDPAGKHFFTIVVDLIP